MFRAVIFTLSLLVICVANAGECEANFCEKNCKKRCSTEIFGQTVTENICYNACLSEEQFCRTTLPANKQACMTSQYYDLTVKGAIEARKMRVVNSFAECRNTNRWITRYLNAQGGEIARWISDTCGCFICEDALSARITIDDTVIRNDKEKRECETLVVRITHLISYWRTADQNSRENIGVALEGIYVEAQNFNRRSTTPCKVPDRPWPARPFSGE